MQHDFDIWYAYRKSVKKFDKKNTVRTGLGVSDPDCCHVKVAKVRIRESCEGKGVGLQVGTLNRVERRRFRCEASLDLHGCSRDVSRKLDVFCLECIGYRMRSAIIITGKGEGILKEAVRSWINVNPSIVSGFFEIIDSSGGSGSFGVKLKLG
jgi:DNA-nicking Smr family endonuclease